MFNNSLEDTASFAIIKANIQTLSCYTFLFIAQNYSRIFYMMMIFSLVNIFLVLNVVYNIYCKNHGGGLLEIYKKRVDQPF